MKDLWKNIIDQNKTRIAMVVGVASLVTGVLFLFSGCNFGDVIKSDIPLQVQQSQGLPSQLTHNQATDTFQDWQTKIEAMAVSWRRELEESGTRVGIAEGITMQTIDVGVPYLNLLLPGLGIVVSSLLVKRPGDVGIQTMTKEKEGSYKKGFEEGKAVVIALSEAVK